MTDNAPLRSAAWRISFLATIAFACGTLVIFVFLHQFVSNDIQRRSDAWLSGEVGVLGDVAGRTPRNALYGRVVGEIAELAAREVPNKSASEGNANNSVFFLQTSADGLLQLWVGAGDGQSNLEAIKTTKFLPDKPTDVRVSGFPVPFRVACQQIGDGSHIYLGLSERDELRVLTKLRLRFFLLWLLVVLLGFGIVFLTTRRMLSHVRKITEVASRIGHSDLSRRVPATRRNDEVSQLAHTLNRMLDRIESSMHQLHTITDALAHDLRSPLTAIRGKLEMSLVAMNGEESAEPIVSVIEELDQLTDFLNKSLDVAEARADALRLTRTEIDLSQLLETMVDLYEPSMTEKGLNIRLSSEKGIIVLGDEGLVHRMIANLLDNELKHLAPASSIDISLQCSGDLASLVFEDDGNGFDPEVLEHLFIRRVKGRNSTGHGLGLAFVDAVARAHSGSVDVENRRSRGARIRVSLPLAPEERRHQLTATAQAG
ncbi:MAG: HAMP domain-containing sensor histidine kinase [Terracidiphilus sp.]|jgi:signal transduction histidine kinase